jgi:hypothetical protein
MFMVRTIENPAAEFNIILASILALQTRPLLVTNENFNRHIE